MGVCSSDVQEYSSLVSNRLNFWSKMDVNTHDEVTYFNNQCDALFKTILVENELMCYSQFI